MTDTIDLDNMPPRAVVQFNCTGTAVGKMRNELDVRMVKPMQERFEMATDEGPFHGGDATAPPPLALFVGGLTGCIMTRVQWDWAAKGRIYETAPKSFEIDIFIDSDDPLDKQTALVQAAKKGCFIEQTLGQSNTIAHKLKTADGWVNVD
jgi:uncharacterized OsmC-like protein